MKEIILTFPFVGNACSVLCRDSPRLEQTIVLRRAVAQTLTLHYDTHLDKTSNVSPDTAAIGCLW